MMEKIDEVIILMSSSIFRYNFFNIKNFYVPISANILILKLLKPSELEKGEIKDFPKFYMLKVSSFYNRTF